MPGRPLIAVSTGKVMNFSTSTGPKAGRVGENLHLDRSDVWHGIDRKLLHRVDTSANDQNG